MRTNLSPAHVHDASAISHKSNVHLCVSKSENALAPFSHLVAKPGVENKFINSMGIFRASDKRLSGVSGTAGAFRFSVYKYTSLCFLVKC